MDSFIIEGGNKLYGKVRVGAAKNSLLPLLAGALLTNEKVTFYDCPELSDIYNMLEILRVLGVETRKTGRTLEIWGGIKRSEIPAELAKVIRSSIFLLGSIITTTRRAKVAFPGGCAIGARPIDIHIKSLRALNIKITEYEDYIDCLADRIIGADITFEKVSVGATENVIMASVLAEGHTTIRNAAREPEIVDLANLLNKMGAKIKNAGEEIIEIDGVKELHGAKHYPISDRIVAGTLLTAVAITGGEIEIENVNPDHIAALISKLDKTACNIQSFYDRICVSSKGRAKPFDIETAPYPYFPTDMQPQAMVLASIADGRSRITEKIFETRFKHVDELKKMGADILVENDVATISGVGKLVGAEVDSTDLRGGAALVLAGLVAEGRTIVNKAYHIDRGYEKFEQTLSLLGAKIVRKKNE